MTPAEQLAAIRRELLPDLARHSDCWHFDVLPKLKQAGIEVLNYDELKRKQRKLLRKYFEKEIFPVLTPLAFDPGHPFPHISNLSMNLAVVVNEPLHGERFARLKVPGTFPRLLRIPSEETAEGYEELGLDEVMSNNFVWLEQVVAANLDILFPGLEIAAAYPFRVTRDADQDIEEDEAADLLATIEESVRLRHFGSAVRLEVGDDMPEHVRDIALLVVDAPLSFVGALIWLQFPLSGPFAIGIILGVKLLASGFLLIYLGRAAKQLARPA